MSRLWDKGLALDERVLRYTAGEDYKIDARLVEYDVKGSTAHAKMLAKQGLLSSEDCTKICDGLATLGNQFASDLWQIELQDEDAHTALESRLTDLIGETGGRIHLGRSRNDQVLCALRLYLLDASDALQESVRELSGSLLDLSKKQGGIGLPGYTHMQQAMPSSVELWADGFRQLFADAIQSLQTNRQRISQNPLGSAAGYGTPGLSIDRDETTASLGFETTQSPVTTVQLSRGKAEAGLLFEIALLLNDLSRLAADLLLFYTQEFGFISLADDVTTGSSIMPQKRNPDVLELVRAAAPTAQACLDECLMITAKLPSGYQRDLQRLKFPVFRSIDLALDSVDIMTYLVSSLEFDASQIHMDKSLDAAEQANKLVTEEGIPFREAYKRIALRYA